MRSASLTIASVFLLAACTGGEKTHSPPAAAAGWPSTRTTDGGSFEVTVEPAGGSPIERNKHFSLEVAVVAKDGNADGIGVKVDADMPAHQHGMNTKPELTAASANGYRADGMLFHMGGDWVITVDVTRGGSSERAIFPVSVE